MLAVLGWSRTIGARTRRRGTVALIGMALAVALGISANYFAVLAFFPVAGGELVYTILEWRQRGSRLAF